MSTYKHSCLIGLHLIVLPVVVVAATAVGSRITTVVIMRRVVVCYMLLLNIQSPLQPIRHCETELRTHLLPTPMYPNSVHQKRLLISYSSRFEKLLVQESLFLGSQMKGCVSRGVASVILRRK